MEIHLTSTTKVIQFDVDGKLVPARVWEGVTEMGVPCYAMITRIACLEDDDRTEFESELESQQHDAPSVEAAAIPTRLII